MAGSHTLLRNKGRRPSRALGTSAWMCSWARGTRKASNAKAQWALPQRSGRWKRTSGYRESSFLCIASRGKWETARSGASEIIGYDAQSQSYPTHTFYNNGLANEWRSHVLDGTWTLRGLANAGQVGEGAMHDCVRRCRYTMRSNWEQSSDGSSWETFWDVKSSKAK